MTTTPPKTYRLLFNGFFLSKPYTGIGYHTQYMLLSLAKQEYYTKILCLVPHNCTVPQSLQDIDTIQYIKIPLLGNNWISKFFWEQIFGALYSLFHYKSPIYNPYPCAFWSKRKNKQIACVHDIIPYVHKEYQSSTLTKLRLLYEKWICVSFAQIVSVSQYSANQIKHMWNTSSIPVIYNGYPENNSHITENIFPDISQKPTIKALYFGGYDTRKNIEYMIQSLIYFNTDNSQDIELSLVGKPLFTNNLYQSLDSIHPGKNLTIHKLGHLSEHELSNTIQEHDMVISLSSEEGFNLPLLQGIMNKKIIIASNIPIHQEIYPYIPLVSLTSPQKASQDILKNILEGTTQYEKLFQYCQHKYNWEQISRTIITILSPSR